MNSFTRRTMVPLTALILLVAAACTPAIRDYGYAPSDDQLSEIVVGVDGRDRVAELVGNPTSESLRGEDAWFYLSMRQETVGIRAPETTDRQLVIVSFNSTGTVRNIERFTMEDGRIITLSRRVTDDPAKGVSFLRQAFSNLGRLRAEDVAS